MKVPRRERKCILATLNDKINAKNRKLKCDRIDPTNKLKFMKKFNEYKKIKNNLMYLVRIYLYDGNCFCYKIGYSDKSLFERLSSLNGQYKSNYKIQLIAYCFVDCEDDERQFHKENTDILSQYSKTFGEKDREIYQDRKIKKRFFNYANLKNFNLIFHID
jgi:hypothetical protein